MLFSKIFFAVRPSPTQQFKALISFIQVFPFVLTGGQAQQISNVARASNFFPVSTLGTAAAVQVANSDTRIYYQPLGGGLNQLCTSNAFATGGVTIAACNVAVVPPAQVLNGTLIAGTNIMNNNGGWSEVNTVRRQLYYLQLTTNIDSCVLLVSKLHPQRMELE
jgi:hypothetical protein